MIFELETAIKNKLEEITRFVAVYDSFVLKTDWYPYASFELSSFNGEFLDVCSNKREFTFNIVVIQETNKLLTRDQAKNIVYKCLEDIIEKFDGEQDLWESTIVKWNVTKWEIWTMLEKEWSIIALSVELVLEIVTTAW